MTKKRPALSFTFVKVPLLCLFSFTGCGKEKWATRRRRGVFSRENEKVIYFYAGKYVRRGNTRKLFEIDFSFHQFVWIGTRVDEKIGAHTCSISESRCGTRNGATFSQNIAMAQYCGKTYLCTLIVYSSHRLMNRPIIEGNFILQVRR